MSFYVKAAAHRKSWKKFYEDAAQFYAFIAEYDFADALADKILSCTEKSLVLFTAMEQLPEIAKKLKKI